MAKVIVIILMGIVFIGMVVIDSMLVLMKIEDQEEKEAKKKANLKVTVVTPDIADNLTMEEIDIGEDKMKQITKTVDRLLKAEKTRRKWRRAACR